MSELDSMYFMALVSVALFIAVWAFVFRLRVRHPLDPLAIMMYALLLRFGLRPAALALRLDGPHPDYLFSPTTTEQYIVLGEIYSAVWLIALAIGTGLPAGFTDVVKPLFPKISRDVSMYKAVAVMMICTMVSLAAFWWLNGQFGGLREIVVALKVEKETTGLGLIRNCGVVGAFISVGVALRLIQKRWHGEPSISPLFILLALGMAMFNGFFLFACGSRSTAAFSFLCLAFGLVTYRRNQISWIKVGLVAVCVLAVAIGLRSARDQLLWGHLAESVEGENPFRQFFVMTNSVCFDAFLLIIRDWSNKLHYGQDFLNGFMAAIPRAVWPDKPLIMESPGSALRLAYENHSNGWPPGGVGEWYWNFGVSGILLGGILTGVVFKVLQVRYGDFIRNPFSLALLVFFVTKLFENGIVTQSLVSYVLSMPLLLVITVLLSTRDRDEEEQVWPGADYVPSQ